MSYEKKPRIEKTWNSRFQLILDFKYILQVVDIDNLEKVLSVEKKLTVGEGSYRKHLVSPDIPLDIKLVADKYLLLRSILVWIF